MTHEKLAAIKSKIAKLLAMAEGTDNPAEAESFMSKVNDLLNEHQIEMFEIRMHSTSKADTDPMGSDEGGVNVYASASWMKLVIHYVARYYGATTVWGKNKNHMPYRIFGRESARATAELMMPFIISQARVQGRAYARDHGLTDSIGARHVGMALTTRISRLLDIADKQRSELQSKALVPVDNLKSYVEDYYGGKLRKGRSSSKGYSSSAAGYADKISLHRQATGTKNKLIGTG